MCDVGEARVLPPSPVTKLRRPICGDEKQQQQQQQDKSSPGSPSRSTPSTPTGLRRASSLEKCFTDPEFFRKQRQRQQQQRAKLNNGGSRESDEASSEPTAENGKDEPKPLLADGNEVITNGASSRSCESDECDGPTNGKDIMAPVLGVPPPPPPAPHMGPDGLILPRKPYNPCLTSTSHKDLHRELMFNQKIGKNVLNQKSELQRALERHREMASRKEAERMHEESCRNDPRTALQRAIEQRAKHIQLAQQPQPVEPPNPLATARAKLRSRTDSQ